MTLEDVKDAFALLDDWAERYRYLIDLGKDLAPLAESEKVDANKVLGCQSQVWVVGERDGTGALRFRADSDAHIVRGLVALVLLMVRDRSATEIAALDPRPTFAELGLDQHLSQGRTNGLLSMVGKIKSIAASPNT